MNNPFKGVNLPNKTARQLLPDSAFADQKARRYPIIDKNHIISAMQSVMWQLAHLPKSGSVKDERIPYLQEIHDCILERAKELHMNLKHNECELCSIKVEFT